MFREVTNGSVEFLNIYDTACTEMGRDEEIIVAMHVKRRADILM